MPRPVPGTYTYEAPRALLEPGETTLPPGTRVRVPFGPGELTGVVLGPGASPPAEGEQKKKVVLKTVRSRFDDPLPPLPEDLLALAGRLAEVTVAPLGLVLKAMLPASAPPGRMLRTALITAEGSARLREPDDRTAGRPGGALPRLSEDDRRILTLLAVSRGAVPLVRIRRELDLSPGRSFARLEREGFLTIGAERLTPEAARPGGPTDPEEPAPSSPPTLTAPQQEAAGALREALGARTFGAFLLDGVTGSGKTEVYFQAIAACLETGRSALLLVPEIALASQQEALLRARFGPGDRGVPQRARRRRAPGRLLAHPARRSAHRARGPLRGARPRPGPRAGDPRRGARRRLQAGRGAALPRPPGRLAPRPRRRRGDGARLGHPLARSGARRGAEGAHPPAAPPPHRGPRAARGGDRGHAPPAARALQGSGPELARGGR